MPTLEPPQVLQFWKQVSGTLRLMSCPKVIHHVGIVGVRWEGH